MWHGAREKPDDARLGEVFHVNDIGRVKRLATISLQRLRHANNKILKFGIALGVGGNRYHMVIGNCAESFKRM